MTTICKGAAGRVILLGGP